jgi:hypothetical protein
MTHRSGAELPEEQSVATKTIRANPRPNDTITGPGLHFFIWGPVLNTAYMRPAFEERFL